MTAPSASKYLTAVGNGGRNMCANTVMLNCGRKKVTFKVSPCMSGEWQCAQVNDVLQAIIDEAYKRGIRDAKA